MRLIDADELWKHKFKSASERMDLDVEYMFGWNDAIDSIVENAPTVDAVEVVRCKDCIYRYHDSKYGYMCNMDSGDPYEQTRGVDDGEWYCAEGKRKDEVTE